jgi:histidyl-tRNA synthetase
MPTNKTQPARGMRDFLPADVRRREYVIGVIKEVYERYGFEPLETPAVENIETLMGKYGEEGNQLIFKILKRGVHESTGEADLALRYDLTVPLARVVAEYKDKLPKFFKRYQIQPVWRADRPARGRFREFYQCDVDVLGSKSMVVEAEIIAAASDALTELGFNEFTIRLNHRQVLTGILDAAGVPAEKQGDALVALDKLDKVGEEGVLREFREREVLSNEAGMALLRLFADVAADVVTAYAAPGRGAEDILSATESKTMNSGIIGRLKEFIGPNGEESEGIRELCEIIDLLSANNVVSKTEIDPSLARGLSYYTGTILEIQVSNLTGSLGGGGRYDDLVGMFLGEDVPACGFSLGLERIVVVMTERGMFPPDLINSPADVMVTIWNQDSISESVALAQELRAAGLRVDLYPEADKVGKQFKYASSRDIPFVAVIGDDERARDEVAIKDMRSGEQRTVKRDEAAAELRKGLAEP